MRNVFDQYSQPENKITHSLVSSLAQDSKLLKEFLYWSVGKKFSAKDKLYVIEQSLPGQQVLDETEATRRGLPDACIFDDNGWILIVESKVADRLTVNQLERHYKTVSRRGYECPEVLVLTTQEDLGNLPDYVKAKTWREVYEWGRGQLKISLWAELFTRYFEVLEGQMVQVGYLKEGSLTKFSGIHFDVDNPYTYIEAKRVLKLLMNEIRKNKELMQSLGIDLGLGSRSAIRGSKDVAIWDYLQFKETKDFKYFTHAPHLTFDISFDRLGVKLTIPNSVKTIFKKRLFKQTYLEFSNMVEVFTERMINVVDLDSTVRPSIKVMQRHYPSRTALPVQDGFLVFDVRTAFEGFQKQVKYQPHWLKAVFEVMQDNKSNVQMQIGMEIVLSTSDIVKTKELIKVVELSAISLAPILDVVFDR